MTGSPLLRLLLVLAGLALLAIPAWRLTGRSAPDPSAVPAAEKKQNPATEVSLTFTSPMPPSLIIVEADGLQVVQSRPEASVTTANIPLLLPPEGVDLVIKATWSAGKTNALRVQASLDGNSLADTTLWGEPDVEDVITLPGVPKP